MKTPNNEIKKKIIFRKKTCNYYFLIFKLLYLGRKNEMLVQFRCYDLDYLEHHGKRCIGRNKRNKCRSPKNTEPPLN